jgi:hypothetical protein
MKRMQTAKNQRVQVLSKGLGSAPWGMGISKSRKRRQQALTSSKVKKYGRN